MPNALAREKSPYLLQHAHNPVAWRPWGEAALAEARAAQKPIFLSIGYSTCHWCHVMAHESFEDEGIAALLNAHFIPVKLDREERPDVDKVYMAYVQALTGHGGWPLSAWLTPELKPFFGGTYFPPEDRPGRAGFGSILRAIARGWETERDKLVAEGERVIGTLREHREQPAAAEAGDFAEAGGAAFEQCFQHLHESFDAARGGFGGAPKFPRAANLFFLFRVAAIQGAADGAGREAAQMAAVTLAKMAQGGIHDHVGGGYHRYSVDDAWLVPHFEKMLYDQAQLALAHLEARLATGDERHAWIARGILAYVARDLTHADGGFFTAEDADSDDGAGGHAEGAFYVWTEAELRDVLGERFPLVAAHYGVLAAGNVPAQHDPHGELRGKNILAQARPLAETALLLGLGAEAASEELLGALEKLRAARARRTRPLLDDKILTATNGLMISAYARASQLLESDPARPAVTPYLAAAVRAAEFVERELWEGATATLYRTWRGGRSEIAAFAEDYAYFAQGLLDLYAASFDVRWLRWAEHVQARMDELFFDAEHGGHFNSAAGATDIVLRLKEDYDGAEPAPSSVAAMNLLRLGALLHDETLRARGKKCLAAFRPQWTRAPHAVPQMLCALEPALDTPRHVVLAGDSRAADFRALAAVLHERPGPRRTVLALTGDGDREYFSARAPWLAGMRAIDGRATAYVCEDFACQAPVTEPAALRALLGGGA